MFDVLQDLQLAEDVAHLIALHALLLVHVFHGEHLLCVPLLHNAHLQVLMLSLWPFSTHQTGGQIRAPPGLSVGFPGPLLLDPSWLRKEAATLVPGMHWDHLQDTRTVS